MWQRSLANPVMNFRVVEPMVTREETKRGQWGLMGNYGTAVAVWGFCEARFGCGRR